MCVCVVYKYATPICAYVCAYGQMHVHVWYVSMYVCTLVYVLYVCSVYAIPVLFDAFLLMEMVCGCTYHGNANERQVRELHMVRKEERMEKQQLTRPEPVTSRSIADLLAAAAMVTASNH